MQNGRTNRIVRGGALAALLLQSAACVTEPAPEPDRVSIIAAGDATLATRGARTFAWSTGATVVGDLHGLDSAWLDQTVRAEIRRFLEARGYRLAVEADRDIAFAIGRTTEADEDQLARTFGMAPGLSGPEEHGTLLIAILDPRTGSPLYRAGAQVRARPELTESARRERIRRAVESLLEPLGPAG